MNEAGVEQPAARRTVTVCNQRGLHARAAARFVKLAETFDAQARVVCRGQSVSALSIMGLMMLAAGAGTEIEIVADGTQAGAAVDALAALVERRFEEES
jgi:phosphocarrier protein